MKHDLSLKNNIADPREYEFSTEEPMKLNLYIPRARRQPPVSVGERGQYRLERKPGPGGDPNVGELGTTWPHRLPHIYSSLALFYPSILSLL